MSRFRRAVLLCTVCVGSSCLPFLYDDGCGGSEFRETVVQGDIRNAAGAKIGFAEMRLSETRNGSESRQLSMALLGPAYGDPGPLSGNVERVRLLSADGLVLREFAFEAGNQHEIVRVPVEDVDAGVVFDQMKRVAIEGRLKLELLTELAGNGQILVPLALQHAGDWARRHCS